MRNRGFVIRDMGFGLEHLDWKDSPGDCNFREECRDSCPMKLNNNKRQNCVNTKTAHCCKHVLHGTAVEREAFQERTGQGELPDRFQSSLEDRRNRYRLTDEIRQAQRLEDQTLQNYEGLSRSVAQTAKVVAVTANNSQIRFACSGEGEHAFGFTDYIQYTVDRAQNSYSEADIESGHAHYEIVSTFLQNIRLSEFSLMDLLYRKYCGRENRIDQAMICPVVEDSGNRNQSIQDRITFAKEYVEIQNILKNSGLFAQIAGCPNPVVFGMYWHYTQQLTEHDREANVVPDAIQSCFSGVDPIQMIEIILKQVSQSQSAKELKNIVQHNEAFLRNSICLQYLARICNVTDNMLLHDDERKIGAFWKVNNDDYRIVAWRMVLTAVVHRRCMERLGSALKKKNELKNLMTEDAPYSLADFSAFQFWSDMFTAYACIKLLQTYRRQYKGLYLQEHAPTYSPWSHNEDASLNFAKRKCSEAVRIFISAFQMPAMERWTQRFRAAFQWNATE